MGRRSVRWMVSTAVLLVITGARAAAVEPAEPARADSRDELVSTDTLLLLSITQLEGAQIKLTPLGDQDEAALPLIMTVHGHTVDWEAFGPWRHLEYVSDNLFRPTERRDPTFMVSAREMRLMIQDMDRLFKQRGKPSAAPYLSATVVIADAPHAPVGLETLLDQDAAAELFLHLRSSLRADPRDGSMADGEANEVAMRELQAWGCRLGLLPRLLSARDVSAQVRVTAGGIRWNGAAQHFERTATLTNSSPEAVKGPLSLVVSLSGTAALEQPHGATCVATPAGRPFVTVPMPSAALEPGESLETTVAFRHEPGSSIACTFQVLAGPGER